MVTSSIRLEEALIFKAKIIGKAQSRSASKQIEHWAKIGSITEDNPDLPYEFVKSTIIAKAEKEAGELEEYSFG